MTFYLIISLAIGLWACSIEFWWDIPSFLIVYQMILTQIQTTYMFCVLTFHKNGKSQNIYIECDGWVKNESSLK